MVQIGAHGPDDWSEIEFRLYSELTDYDSRLANDGITQALYDTGLFNWDIDPETRAQIRETLRDRLWDDYGIDFDDVFDWEAYRASYDEA